MVMTTKSLEKLQQMHAAGWNDQAISDATGIKSDTVRRWRVKLGLPAIRKHRAGHSNKRYSVYDTFTNEFVVEGTSKECADSLGISISYFYSSATKYKQGSPVRYAIRATS